MSFLKISDPLKRDAIVKEYLELKKKIRSNLLSERIGEQQLQTDLSKFYKPITETQKTTTREITEGLKPIREGIEKLPEAIQPIREGIEKLPEAIQPLGKATEEKEEDEEEEKEEKEEEEDESVGEIAINYLKIPEHKRDTTFGIYKKNGDHYIGNTHVIIKDDDIIIKETGERFTGTHGLWKLITSKNPSLDKIEWDKLDEENYVRLLEQTYVLHQGNNPNNPHAKSSGGRKWNNILTYIWHTDRFPKKGEYEGEGVVVIPSDPNALLERLDLLLASQEAGHTGVRNELICICDELKRQNVLDTKAYKKLNHLIKK